jgi:hypothetical protein
MFVRATNARAGYIGSMRNALALLVVGLVPAAAMGAEGRPPKEWQPVIEGAVSALQKKDAAALDKLLVRYVEIYEACGPMTKDPKREKEQAQELDSHRERSVQSAIEDCNLMSWKTAKRLSTTGGAPHNPGKCDKARWANPITIEYSDVDLDWTITLQPVVLKGKYLLSLAPRCNSSMKK